MSSPYVLYNATLKRIVPYQFSMRNLKEARYALHHLTQRKKSCIVLIDTTNSQVQAVRVSQQSKHKFPRNYFIQYTAFLYDDSNLLVVFNFETGEVIAQIPVEEL